MVLLLSSGSGLVALAPKTMDSRSASSMESSRGSMLMVVDASRLPEGMVIVAGLAGLAK